MYGNCLKFIPAGSHSAFKPLRRPRPFQGSPLIIAESRSAAGENEHCFIYTSGFVNEPLWTALWVGTQWERLFS